MNYSLRPACRALAVGAAVLAASALVPQPASAAVSCSYHDSFDWAIVQLGATGDLAKIAASSDTRLLVNGAQCGAATVLNTDTVTVLDNSGGSTKVQLDGSQASFAPGVTDEDPGPDDDLTSEIEFDVQLGAGNVDDLIVEGHKAGASMVAGTKGVNLNAGAELFGVDVDVTFSGVDELSLNGSEAVDWLSGQGGAGTGQPATLPLWLSGRGGGDELHAGESQAWRTFMDGGSGADVLVGGAHGAQMNGGPGDDALSGGPGGLDAIYYDGASAGVHVDLALTGPQDTRAAGVDTISDVEALSGTAHDDVLKGGGDYDRLTGHKGDDVLEGRGGYDYLLGDEGADTLRPGTGDGVLDGGDGEDAAAFDDAPGPVTLDLGVPGEQQTVSAGKQTLVSVEDAVGSPFADHLTGSAGPNAVDGGAGADTIAGGDGSDRLAGGAGLDAIDSRDAAADDVSCGEGPDALAVDPLDTVAPDCAPPASGGGSTEPASGGGSTDPGPAGPSEGTAPGSGPAVPLSLVVDVPGQSPRSVVARGLRVVLRCSTACRAAGRLAASRRVARRLGLSRRAARRLGRLAPVDLAAGTSRTATVPLTRAARRALRDTRRARLSLRAHAVDGAGGGAAPVRVPVALRAR
jgi:Ca2+-binding RTX toxin-like protein